MATENALNSGEKLTLLVAWAEVLFLRRISVNLPRMFYTLRILFSFLRYVEVGQLEGLKN